MNNFLLKYLLFCICIGYVMSAKAQNYINGRILDIQNKGLDAAVVMCKRFRDASRYTSKKISLKLLFLSDIFLFPFVRQQFPILAYRCSWRQCCCFVDNIGYIFKEVNTLQSAGACKRIEHSCPFGTSMRPEEKRVSSG